MDANEDNPSDQRRELVDEIAAEALVMAPDEAEAYVRKRCQDTPGMVRDVLAVLARAQNVARLLAKDDQTQGGTLANAGSDDRDDGPPPEIPGYRIIRKIAAGGMGVVWLAEQQHPRREVALKVVRPGMASGQMLQRFELESHVLGRLQHPGIAQVYEAGTHDAGGGPQPYFAMEYVQSARSLVDYADQKQLSVRSRLELFARVCDAVQHAHQKGVIHRDIKPENILVDQTGQPKILDFGIARAIDSDMRLTTITKDVGHLMGTLPYMSPEQTTGDPDQLDLRSDVYALGVTLYELLAGKLPYDLKRRGLIEMIRVIRQEEPTRLSRIDRMFRGDIDTILAKALEKDKDRRYPSASELANDLRRHLHDETVLARPPSAWYRASKFARRNKVLVAGASAVLLAILVGGIVSTVLWFRAEAARDVAETRTDQALRAEDQALHAERRARRTAEREELARRRAEGNLYLQRIAAARWQWWLVQIPEAEELLDACPRDLRGWEWRHLKWRCASEDVRIPCGRTGTRAVAFSPNGRRILRVTDRGGRQEFDARTGRLLADEAGAKSGSIGSPFAVSGDLRWIVSCHRAGKMVELRQVTSGKVVRTIPASSRVRALAISAGASLAARGTEDRDVVLWNPTTGQEIHRLGRHETVAASLAFSADAKLLAVGTQSGNLAVWDLIGRKRLFRVRCYEDTGIRQVAFSPKGALLATTARDDDTATIGRMAGEGLVPAGRSHPIKIWDLATQSLHAALRGHTRAVGAVAFDDTGEQLLSASWDLTMRIWDIADGREVACLRGQGISAKDVAIRPDGRGIVSVAGGVIRTWPAGADQVAVKVAMRGGTSLVFTPDERTLLTARGASLYSWDVGTGAREVRVRDLGVTIGPLACLPGEKPTLALGTGHGTVQFRDMANDEIRAEHHIHPGRRVSAMVFHPGGALAASVGDDPSTRADANDELTLWNPKTGAIIHRLSAGRPGRFVRLAFQPDGRALAATWYVGAGRNRRTAVRIFSTTTGQELRVLETRADLRLPGLAYHPKGELLAGIDSANTIHVWNATTGAVVRTWKPKTFAFDLAFSPDGTRLVTVGSFLKVWDTRTWQEVFSADSTVGIFQATAFGKTGQALAAAGQHGFTAVWRATPPPRAERAQPASQPARNRHPVSIRHPVPLE